MNINFNLNGIDIECHIDPATSLLLFLRSRGLFSVKHGCDLGECGACTVLLDSKAVNACLLLMPMVAGKNVETLEYLSQPGQLHPLQDQFLKRGAVQCGYCTPAQILALAALRRVCPEPDETQIRDALSGILCRCTGYVKPVEVLQS